MVYFPSAGVSRFFGVLRVESLRKSGENRVIQKQLILQVMFPGDLHQLVRSEVKIT